MHGAAAVNMPHEIRIDSTPVLNKKELYLLGKNSWVKAWAQDNRARATLGNLHPTLF